MHRKIRPFLFAVFAALCLAPAPAGAADYVVHTCRLPDGAPAPTDGWSANGSAPYVWFANTCADGGSMAAGLRGISQPTNTSNIGWGFNSGAAAIRGYSIRRYARVSGSGLNASMFAFTSDARNIPGAGLVIDYCAFYVGCAGFSGDLARAVPHIPEESHGWFLTIGCGGYDAHSCNQFNVPDFGDLRVERAAFTLTDDEQPNFSDLSGSLTDPVAADGSLRFMGADKISGVARASIDVDGAEAAAVSAGGARCTPVGQAGPLKDYRYRQPCPDRRQFELTLPPGAMTAGTHTIRARVFDAAGNATTVLGPRRITVAQPVKGAAVATARFVPDGPARLRARYGARSRLSGVLESIDGAPLAGAPVTVELGSSAAARRLVTRGTVTGLDGRYAIDLPTTASRSIRLSHAASRAVWDGVLSVRAALRLKARSSRVPALGRMRLTGRIPGERALRGASVAIKVRSGRRWRTVGIARADRRGRFSFRYRFRRTRHARFSFRAVALGSSDLTLDARPSRPVVVRVG